MVGNLKLTYLTSAINLILEAEPSAVEVMIDETRYHIRSDIELQGTLLEDVDYPREFDSMVLAGLSEWLLVEATQGNQQVKIEYREGKRTRYERLPSDHDQPSLSFSFRPDASIFELTKIAPSFWNSYLRRQSHLRSKVRFSLTADGTHTTYFAENGMLEMLESFASPFQLMHAPIFIKGERDGLQLEMAFSYHSSVENWILTYVNRGRPVDGGTHENGLVEGIEQLSESLRSQKIFNGVLAILSIRYDDLQFEGCLRSKISNPELFEYVKEMVVAEVMRLVKSDPKLAQALAVMRPYYLL